MKLENSCSSARSVPPTLQLVSSNVLALHLLEPLDECDLGATSFAASLEIVEFSKSNYPQVRWPETSHLLRVFNFWSTSSSTRPDSMFRNDLGMNRTSQATQQITRRALFQAASVLPLPAILRGSPHLPNFVFLISDDHSVPDLGCYGNDAIHTPNLDRMAREGMRFTHAYVASPQCSPNRSAIFTGCTPHTTATSRLHTPMPPWEETFLEPLRQKGYYLGAFRKVHQGDEFNKRWDFYDERGVSFARFFEKLPAGRPFFLHVGFHEPHRPYRKGTFHPPHDPAKVKVPAFLPDDPQVREDLALYYDEIASMDAQCGEVFHLLEKHGLAENTLVIFTGDNGMPFPRAKGTCYEAGIRVPLLAWWPGKIAPGTVSDAFISHVDLPVTWLDAAGIPRPQKMQGRSFLNLLLGKEYQERDAIFSERNWHNTFDPIRCVRTRRYKLIFNAAPRFPYRPPTDLQNSPSWQAYVRLSRRRVLSPELMRLFEPARPLFELYDLEKDPNEFNNLADRYDHHELLEELKYKLSDWMHATYDFLPPMYRGIPASKGPDRPNSI